MRLGVGLLLSLLPCVAQTVRPPNVLVILADDQGTVDLNIYGADDLHTPHLDALARSGVRFTQFYVGAPVCSPSRAALLTGRYPQRGGVPGNVGITARGMPSEQYTMAEMLRDAGYRTALIGKWHLGSVNGRGPLDQGFETFFGHWRGCIDNYSHFFYWSGPNVHDLWRQDQEIYAAGDYFPDMMVRETKEFLRENVDRPFFLYLPFNIPHYPLQGSRKWRDHYSTAEMPANRFLYASLVSTLDERVGQVVDYLDELGIRDDTLIIYLSDHGHSTEERAMFGGGSAGPYRGAKFSLLEGGIRVPAIISLTGVVPQDEVRDQFATSLDFFPTVAELTGAEIPDDHLVDGRSLLPILRDHAASSAHDVFHWQLGDQWAVRQGDWKLVVNGRDTDRSPLEGAEKAMLSNLSHDATERTTLAGGHKDLVDRLTALHEAWADEVVR